MSRYEARRHDDEVELPRTTTAVMELPKLLDPEEPVEVTTCADGGQSQPALPFRSSGTDEPPSSAVGAPTFGPAPASWHPPSSKPPTWSPHGAETAGYPPIPSMVRASKGTIGQQLTRGQWPAAERPLGGAKESLARVSPEAPPSRPRAVELLWCAPTAHARLRKAAILEGAPDDPEPAEPQARREVHRALATPSAAEDLEQTLWAAVDRDGLLSPPVVSVSGELELCFDDAERIKTLVPIARMFIAGDGELEERLDAALRIAESIAGASTLVARELGALRRAWSESTLAIPLADLELEADMILVGQRRPRSLEIFHGKHIVTRLHTPLHACAVPIYLPEAALADLPLERRFNAQLFVELNPRRVATEESRLAGAALAVARLID